MSNELIQQFQYENDEESREILIEQWLDEAHYNEQRFEQLKAFGVYYEQLGYVELALMVYLRLQAIEPQTTLIIFIANAYAHIYEYEKALYWLRLIPEQEMDERVRYQKSLWLIEVDKTEEAKDILMQLVKDFPTYSDPYFALADYYVSQGDSQRALPFVEALYEYFPNLSIRGKARQKIVAIKLHQEQIPLGELEELMTNEALPLTDAYDYYLLADIYRLSQRYELAEKYTKQSLAIDPNNSKAVDMLVELEKMNDMSMKEQVIDWFQENIPENQISPIDLTALSGDEILNDNLIQRLVGYLAYSEEIEEQYQIIRAVCQHFLLSKDFEGFDHFMNQHALNYLLPDELSFFFGKKAYIQQNFYDAIEYFEIARDYLIPEVELIELLVKSYVAINDLSTAKSLVNEYNGTEYQTDYLDKLRRRVNE